MPLPLKTAKMLAFVLPPLSARDRGPLDGGQEGEWLHTIISLSHHSHEHIFTAHASCVDVSLLVSIV